MLKVNSFKLGISYRDDDCQLNINYGLESRLWPVHTNSYVGLKMDGDTKWAQNPMLSILMLHSC